MPIEDGVFGLFNFLSAGFVVGSFLILFLVFYAFFAFILFRQIQLMGKQLPTPLVPVLKFVATIHLGAAVAILFITIGVF